MKYAVVTFGCRVNQADSLAIEAQLRSRGAVEAPAAQADVVIVNSCSVTANADQAVRQTVRKVVRANPGVKVVVTGCYASRRPDEVRALPNVMAVVGNANKDSLGDDLATALELTTATRFADGDGPCGDALMPGVGGRTALTLRVQTGCNEQCSYCIIPRTRGSSRSRAIDSVLGDIDRGVAAGYKEIWITGVHLGSYGSDLGNGTTLTGLVRRLGSYDADVLFRISSLEPTDCTREIVETIAASPRLAPHFHLPMQHAAHDMLRAMRRPYSPEFYRELACRIRTMIPHASIGTDVIVGFPGEMHEHFAALRDAVATLPLSYIHVFPYSDRPGTRASAIDGKVDGVVIRQRGAELRAIGARLTRDFRDAQAGTTRRALTVDDGRSAVTDNYLKVPLEPSRPRNSWVDVVVA
jgi:threonylcarbamoyladenosine tRNA methylthiotransferase MtaB